MDMNPMFENWNITDEMNERYTYDLELMNLLAGLHDRLQERLKPKKAVVATIAGRKAKIVHVGRATLEQIKEKLEDAAFKILNNIFVKDDYIEDLEYLREELTEARSELITLREQKDEDARTITALREELAVIKLTMGCDELRRSKRVL